MVGFDSGSRGMVGFGVLAMVKGGVVVVVVVVGQSLVLQGWSLIDSPEHIWPPFCISVTITLVEY